MAQVTAQMTPWVRQYALRDLLDDSFDLFKERAASLLLAGAIPYLLVVVYFVAMRALYIPESLVIVDISSGNFRTMMDQVENIGDVFQYPRYVIFITGLVALHISAITLGSLLQCRIAAYHALGRPVTVRTVLAGLVKPFFSQLVVSVVQNAMAGAVGGVGALLGFAGGGIILVLLAGIFGEGGGAVGAVVFSITVTLGSLLGALFVFVYVLPAPVALVVDHDGPFAAIGRAMRYAGTNFREQFWAYYAFWHVPMLLFVSLAGLGPLLVEALRSVMPGFGAGMISSVLVGAGTVVFFGMNACFATITYIDGRCRSESFDLLLLAREIGMGEEFERAYAAPGHTQVAMPPHAGYPNYAASPPPTPGQGFTYVNSAVAAQQQQATSLYPDYSAPPPQVAPAMVLPPPAPTPPLVSPEPATATVPAAPTPAASEEAGDA